MEYLHRAVAPRATDTVAGNANGKFVGSAAIEITRCQGKSEPSTSVENFG